MLSLTFNAPKNAFDDPDQYLFRGRSVDDLFFPMHMNFRFFAMQPLDTFVCYDVLKNPDIENDLVRFEAHLNKHFQESDA
jgi:modulator of drug activity B